MPLAPVAQHPLVKAFGPADPALPMGIRFHGVLQRVWERETKQLSAGYYLDGFLRLMDAEIAPLSKALDAWSFLVPPAKDRMILGYNAYGSILVLERANSGRGRVHILDPLRLAYSSNPGLDVRGTLEYFLPKRLLADFTDDAVYRSFMGGDRLPHGYVLAPKRPEPLGGRLEKENLQVEEILAYYETTAPLYAASFAPRVSPRSAKQAQKPSKQRAATRKEPAAASKQRRGGAGKPARPGARAARRAKP
jgi:hypothetical protein